MAMRFATWNINGMKARLGYLLRWLEEVSPDVVGFQEIKTTADKFPRDELAAAGYQALVYGQKGWNGVAVLTKSGADLVSEGLAGQDEAGARLLTADVGGVLFTTVYVPNGKSLEHGDYPMKLEWLDALVTYVAEVNGRGKPHLLCGDFNVVPAAIDSWSEERMAGRIHHSEPERARIAALLETGMVDLWREARPDDPGFTWWDYRQGAFHKRQGLRIDLLLATPDLAARRGEIKLSRRWRKKLDGMIASDHLPVWVEFES
jgi:exodeoxyribonuclease-3